MLDQILISENFNSKLCEALKKAEKVSLLSAFVTREGSNFLIDNTSQCTEIRCVFRGRPADLLNGVCDLSAIRSLIEHNIPCFFYESLHAKVYLIDEIDCYVGSANLTGNGLRLFGCGNLEVSVQTQISLSDLQFINRVFQSSIPIGLAEVEQLEEFVIDGRQEILGQQSLSDVLNIDVTTYYNSLIVSDFPWCNLQSAVHSESDRKHDEMLFFYGAPKSQMQSAFLSSRVYKAIYNLVFRQKSKELYFGALVAALHGLMAGDEKVYRKDLKHLLQNFLSYNHIYGGNFLQVDRPNYSQRIYCTD